MEPAIKKLPVLVALPALVTAAWLTGSATAEPVALQKFGDWRIGCEPPKGAAKDRCYLYQTVFLKADRKQVLLFAVGRRPTDNKLVVVVTVPLGIFLPGGLTFSVPGTAPARVAIETCVIKGCRAGLVLAEPLLNAMLNGTRARVSLQNMRRRPINLPISLDGFSAGLAALPKAALPK